MRRGWTAIGVAALALAMATPAAAMNVTEFLAKAQALKAKGVLAMFSPDLKLLGAEMRTITREYRAEQQAAKAAGRRFDSCPPEKVKLDHNQLLADLERIPPAQRGMSMKSAFALMMKRRYPCPG